MFPIFSTSGRVIGFGARKIREDDPVQGKYINSPETPIYNKSRVLFGLFHSKEAVRSAEHALMVEGYADLISLYQAGIQNVVASSGTALTEDQVQLITRYTKRLTLVYDSDSAGSNAMLRGMDVVLAHDLEVRIVELPEGEDPDSFVRKHGGKEFSKLVDQAVSFIDFKAKQLLRAGAFNTPDGKAEAVRSIVQSIAKMPDELKRNFYIKEVSAKYDIYETVLYRELERWIGEGKRTSGSGSRFQTGRSDQEAPPPGEFEGNSIPRTASVGIRAAERDVLKLLLENQPGLINFIFTHITLADIEDEQANKLAERILAHLDETGSAGISGLLGEIEDPALKGLLTDIAVSKYELSKQWETMEVRIEDADPWDIARGAIASLKKTSLQRQIEANQKLLRQASQRGGDAIPFVQRHQELIRLLKEVESPEFLKSN
jgi:DNA primase